MEVFPEFRLGIGYKHSLEKTDILEIFKVENEKLVLEEVVCESLYPGSGDRFFAGTCTTAVTENKMVVKGETEPLSCLYLRVGEFSDHCLFFNDRKVRLLDWANPGEKLGIYVVKRFRFPWVKRSSLLLIRG